MNIIDNLKKRVSNNPEDICLISPEEEFTFSELDAYSNKIAMAIQEKSYKNIIPLFI